ncbi:hypothetical protein RA984_21175, partial [Mycobacteroides abscessus subsp. massiliense]
VEHHQHHLRVAGPPRADALILLQYLNIRTAEAVWEIVGRYFTDTMISDRSRLFVDDIINYLGGA